MSQSFIERKPYAVVHLLTSQELLANVARGNLLECVLLKTVLIIWLLLLLVRRRLTLELTFESVAVAVCVFLCG